MDGPAGKSASKMRKLRESVRTVLVVLPPLVQHHFALVLNRLGQRRQQPAHPVGFHPERQLRALARNDLPVVRPIRAGRAVHGRTGLLQRLEVSVG